MAVLNHGWPPASVQQLIPPAEVRVRSTAIKLHAIKLIRHNRIHIASHMFRRVCRCLILEHAFYLPAVVHVPIHLQTLLVAIRCHALHTWKLLAVDQRVPICSMEGTIDTRLWSLPAIIKTNIHIAKVCQAFVYSIHQPRPVCDAIHNTLHHLLAYIHSETVPTTPAHRWRSRKPVIGSHSQVHQACQRQQSHGDTLFRHSLLRPSQSLL
mmetsp:Transcript_16316/g.37649  ORF Transcript_16316/g.37649 Transcript_16316/m.37649 type:complete len:210 (+) Transcript_16316:1125-1754(+)